MLDSDPHLYGNWNNKVYKCKYLTISYLSSIIIWEKVIIVFVEQVIFFLFHTVIVTFHVLLDARLYQLVKHTNRCIFDLLRCLSVTSIIHNYIFIGQDMVNDLVTDAGFLCINLLNTTGYCLHCNNTSVSVPEIWTSGEWLTILS